MKEMDDDNGSIWLHCLLASTDLEPAIGPPTLDQLTERLDLPRVYRGIGLQPLERSADEEMLSSFAGIFAFLI
jgi:hypothetical protein